MQLQEKMEKRVMGEEECFPGGKKKKGSINIMKILND